MYAPVKSLGQNFLSDTFLALRIVNSLEIQSGEDIIEIGPGHGVLTDPLVDATRSSGSDFYAVEIDDRFFEKLSSKYSYFHHVHIIRDDILDYLPKFNESKNFKVIGALPFYITSPIIHKIIKMKPQPTVCVFIIQKEVAEKIVSKAPDSSYMSSFVQSFYNVEILEIIEKTKFTPVPKVDGALVKLTLKNTSVLNIEKYEGFLHKCYANPRKMLNKAFSKEEIQKLGINAKMRPQNYNAEDWLSFFYEI